MALRLKNKHVNSAWSRIHSVANHKKAMANECEARIKSAVRFQWLHLQFYSLSEFGGKEEK